MVMSICLAAPLKANIQTSGWELCTVDKSRPSPEARCRLERGHLINKKCLRHHPQMGSHTGGPCDTVPDLVPDDTSLLGEETQILIITHSKTIIASCPLDCASRHPVPTCQSCGPVEPSTRQTDMTRHKRRDRMARQPKKCYRTHRLRHKPHHSGNGNCSQRNYGKVCHSTYYSSAALYVSPPSCHPLR